MPKLRLDIQLQQVRKSISSGQWVKTEEIKPYFHCRSELSVKGNIVLKDKRIVIPENLRQRTLAIAHERHQGIVKTKALLREKVWWPGIDRQIESLIKSCHACQVTAQPTVKCEPFHVSIFSAHRPHPPEFSRGQIFLYGSSFESVLVICLFFQIGQSIYFQKAKELKINNLFSFFMFCLPI